MNYDVFISYSRNDLRQIEPLVKDLERRANVTCWIDWNGIESGAQFEDVIIKAIDSVSVVLFFVSENSMNSQYAKMEVNYAYNTKKKVVPVVLDGGALRGWFLFKFGAVDYIDIHEPRQYDKLIQNLQAWCGSTARSTSTIQTSSPSAASTSAHPHFVPKTYRIGDFYDDGKKRGVVFDVSADGRHGKIVSLMQSEKALKWDDTFWNPVRVSATNSSDGLENQSKVRRLEGWRKTFPAFLWCVNLDDGWYLPAIEELRMLVLDKQVCDVVNQTLVSHGATPLFGKGALGWYWSSTEVDKESAKVVDTTFGLIKETRKNNSNYVRAVSAF